MSPTIGVNLRVTGHCNQGGRKYMEDAFVVAYQQTEDEKDLEYGYFGIFDGHGGREAALYAKEHLMNHIVNQKNFWSDNDELVLKAIKDGFLTTHFDMWKEVDNWPRTFSGLPSTSGTTASVAFIRHGKMYVGHVGDSKIVLGCQDKDSNSWVAQPLTKDHKPESPAERQRIHSVGGSVMNKAGVERVVWKRPRIGHKGPVRRSTHFDRIPFLAVARSLGDLWSYNYFQGEFVVSPEPDVAVVTLDPKRDRCIVLASDGLWNMMTPQDAVRIVQEAEHENERLILEAGQTFLMGKPVSNPSKLLVDRALNRWYSLKMRADNTSVITVMLDPPGPPKSEVLLRQRMMQRLRPRDEQAEVVPDSMSDDTADMKIKKPPEHNSFRDFTETSDSFQDSKSSCLPRPVVLSPKKVVVVKHERSDASKNNSNPNIRLNAGWPSHPFSRTSPTHGCYKIGCSCQMLSSVAKHVYPSANEARPPGSSLNNILEIVDKKLKAFANKDENSKTLAEHDNEESWKPLPEKPSNPSLADSVKNSRAVGNPPADNQVETNPSTDSMVKLWMDTHDKLSEQQESHAGSAHCRPIATTIIGMKRKLSAEESHKFIPLKHLRPHNRAHSWTGEPLSSCKMINRNIYLHSTRTRLRIRKIKV
ncbi:uncharacterized protein LOC106478700 [Limulus polyphemus]|uniref:Uncharacterized protein LOC106478700 n=1 Tax=Limulus polyphemus TaxID=6850 RepID=A0ABM1S353_LIMPO|nr:uncharacterized protein LOC106478700 [Limulus polyphemus]